MSRIGLALSGGGFRATLYHLGVLRFLRDAGLLHQISHVTSVSGGSVTAAHLVSNWDRYSGSSEEFDAAAGELLDFVRLDIRNRVVRRYPIGLLTNLLRWITFQGWSRRLTRPGLLEAHYEKHLLGDRCLYELPVVPQLHMLSTNINEGCLCSFTRTGVLVEKRQPTGDTYFERVPSALGTVPMAVTASSAFPGFFPPLQLTAKDIGAETGKFPPHVLTDGGVYDNLGVRMFRHIKKSWIRQETPLIEDDFCDLPAAIEFFDRAMIDSEDRLAVRLHKIITARSERQESSATGDRHTDLPGELWSAVMFDKFYQEPEFLDLPLSNQRAQELLQIARTKRELDYGDHLLLNRCLLNAAYQQISGGPLLHEDQPTLKTVIVSDAGKDFNVSRQTTGGSLIATSIRATDILMDRVRKLEVEHFNTASDFVFAPISRIIARPDDPTALHPEIQRQVASMRTDLDKFTDLEMSSLIRHGYAVMRSTCRNHPELFGDRLPAGAPWDPISRPGHAVDAHSRSQTTNDARQLQGSARRKILGNLFQWRDWMSWVYLPLILFLLIGVPYLAYKYQRNARRSDMIVEAITYSNPDFQLVLELARENTLPGDWLLVEPEEVDELEPADNSNFLLTADTRVLDLRSWEPGAIDGDHPVISYRRMRVRRDLETGDNPDADQDIFLLREDGVDRPVQVRCDTRLPLQFRKAPSRLANGELGAMYEAAFDLSRVPDDKDFDIGFEVVSNGIQGRIEIEPRVQFPINLTTNIATMWVLLPSHMPYESFEVLALEGDQRRKVRVVEPTYSFNMADGTVFGWMIVAPKQGTVYECRWHYLD